MEAALQLHASCVAFSGNGVLIRGRSGSGKSGLAMQLIGLGADLVADDRTDITMRDGFAMARAPRQLRGMIEARGVGVLRARSVSQARLRLVVDLDICETERYPEPRFTRIADADVPVLHKIENAYFASAIQLYLNGGRWMDDDP